jgi:hypothetical protein
MVSAAPITPLEASSGGRSEPSSVGGRATCGGARPLSPAPSGGPFVRQGAPAFGASSPHSWPGALREWRRSRAKRKLLRVSVFGLVAGTILVVAIILAFWLLASFIEDVQRVARRR